MGAVKSLVMDGEEFAQDHYNLPEADFKQKVKEKYGHVLSIEARSAIDHWFEIQMEMKGFYRDEGPY